MRVASPESAGVATNPGFVPEDRSGGWDSEHTTKTGEKEREIAGFAEEIDLRPFGILPGKCADDRVTAEAFGVEVSKADDPTQRATRGCVVSRGVGIYDSRRL